MTDPRSRAAYDKIHAAEDAGQQPLVNLRKPTECPRSSVDRATAS
jgi:hypothetical protein